MEIKKRPEDFVVIEELEIDNKGKNFVYLLEKKNIGTVDAVRILEQKYKCKIKFCGNKDKYAVTKQYISCSKKLSDTKIKTSNFEIKLSFEGTNSKALSLGSHNGNRFEIRVYKTKKKSFEMKEYSFPNYFGEQRFSEKNVKIGELLLERKFKEALEFIDDRFSNEFLTNHPNDYLGALKKIPKKTIRLLLAAVQSAGFNSELSEKIEIKNSKKNFIELIVAKQELNFPKEEMSSDKKIEMKGWDSGDRRFLFKEYPEISLEGVERESFVKAEEIIFDGEIIKFYLPKGSYATIFLRAIFLENINY